MKQEKGCQDSLKPDDYEKAQFILQRIKISLHPSENFEKDLKTLMTQAAFVISSGDNDGIREIYDDMAMEFQKFMKDRWDELKAEIVSEKIRISHKNKSGKL